MRFIENPPASCSLLNRDQECGNVTRHHVHCTLQIPCGGRGTIEVYFRKQFEKWSVKSMAQFCKASAVHGNGTWAHKEVSEMRKRLRYVVRAVLGGTKSTAEDACSLLQGDRR